MATIREAETHCAAMIREVETHYEVMIKETEAHCATQMHALGKSHEESMLKLECEVLAEDQRKGVITEHSWRFVAQPCGFVPLKPMGTDVFAAAPYWQCNISHHAGYHSTTSPSRQRTAINSLPTHSVKDTSTPTETK